MSLFISGGPSLGHCLANNGLGADLRLKNLMLFRSLTDRKKVIRSENIPVAELTLI